jgi:superfamily II DNA or RNA helicase
VLKESKNNLVFINNNENDIKSLLDEIQKDVKLSHVKIVSAFFNYKGFVKEFLENSMKNKIKIELITGSNPIHLNPTEAKTLFEEYNKNKSIFSLSRFEATKKNHDLHSKFYLFYEKGNSNPSYFLFGSSNMSVSGFSRNYESNLFGTNTEILEILENEFNKIPHTVFDPTIYKEKPKGGFTEKELGVEGFSPFPYQQKIIDIIKKEFEKKDKGNVILPCGTGKTLVSLWLKEQMKFGKVLIFLPSLALLNQTMTEWHNQKTDDYQTMCVCSDTSIKLSEDETRSSLDEVLAKNIINKDRITTDPDTIKEFIDNNEKFVIFSTYHSSKEILKACGKNKKFDCVFYDETHNIATIKSKTSKEGLTQSHHIESEKKLFMTATPKIVNPDLIDGIKKEDYQIYSMDDEKTFGSTFYDMSFREAIDNKDIPVLPYEILLAVSDGKTRKSLDRKQVALMKIYNEKNEKKPRFNVNKVISYHSDVKNAKQFISNKTNFDKIRNEILKRDLYANHINGQDNAKKRKKILDGLKNSDMGIITNCRCLSEGINSPSIDAVFFSDPKTNVIDIVQATGRAMRKDPKNLDKKKAYIIIPIDDEPSLVQLVRILQALALTDDHTQSLIDKIVKAQKNNQSISLPDWIITVPELPSKQMKNMLKDLKIIVAKNNIPIIRGRVKGTGKGFFKRLAPFDVHLTSGPGEMSIPGRYMKYFGKLNPSERMSDKYFDIKFKMNKVENGKTIWENEENVDQVRIKSFEGEARNSWTASDGRFTFRNRKFYVKKGMEEGDVLLFEKTDDDKRPMKITLLKKDSKEALGHPYNLTELGEI